MKNLPEEIKIAKESYESAFSKIRHLVVANYEKYKGTKYEDCPPTIEEQFKFFVLNKNVTKNFERLNKIYKNCPKIWAYWVTWYEKNNTEKNSV